MRASISTLIFSLLTFWAVAQNTVVDIIVNSPNHETLEAAVIAAELNDDLAGPGPFTVFAPTDAAFAALPDGLLDQLLADPTGQLAQILLYHVAGDSVVSTALTNNQTITTLQGRDVLVTINDDGVFINNAQVTVADVTADNGVVHVIDAVLVPAALDVQVQQDATFGNILTDEFGRTLYFFSRDAADTSACVGGCLNNWPVFYAENLVAGDGLDSSNFGEITRGDGAKQSTYKGWPLYYFVNDAAPGDVNGDARANVWFVAKPDYSIMLMNDQLTGNNGVNYTGDYTPGDEIVQYFTDDAGATLYVFSRDFFGVNNFTRSDFSNNGVWPIYEETGMIVPSILDASDFGTIDVFGRTQLTYKGWPLYYFGADGFVRGSNKGVSVPQPGIWPVAVQTLETATPATVVDIIVESPDHTILEQAVTAAGLVETLSGDGPFTVFAPTDAAFQALPPDVIQDLLATPEGELTQILLYHVLNGDVRSTDLTDGMTAVTINGKVITVTINDDGVFINDAQVTVADIEAGNGVVHVIDAVLLPPNTVWDIIEDSEDHNTLQAAVEAAGLDSALKGAGPFTVFAPTDAAFAALPQEVIDALLADPQGDLTDILLYHVLGAEVRSTDLMDGMTAMTLNGKDITVTINDDGVFINDAQVTVADIETDNGVVHVINAVLIPPTVTVFDVIANSGDHLILAAAITDAGLVETLEGEGPFTVFAPTDDAFTALPDELVDAVLGDPQGLLTDVLLYHVLSGKVLSSDLMDGMTATTINGKDITVTINDDGVFINNAKVTVADIEADNGVVHVIDAVLLPPNTVWHVIQDSEVHHTLEAAIAAAGLDTALQGEGPFTVFAPTDAAFGALPDGVIDALLADPQGELTDILLYHVLGADVRSTDLMDGMTAMTLNGKNITVTINDDGVFINDAQVILADIEADNGVVHVIDAVLIPPRVTVWDVIVNSEDHDTLEIAITAAGLDDVLQDEGPYTVFAPTDDAFAALPEGVIDALLADPQNELADILLYHVLGAEVRSTDLMDGMTVMTLNGQNITVTINDDGVFINNAQVTVADIETDNGVVHVIDAILMPPTTVWDIIVDSEDHNTLEAAITAAGLDTALEGEGPFTVFAPTDAAFAVIPQEVIDALLADPQGELTDILLYHVLGAEVRSTDLMDGMTAMTLNGKDITVTINDDGVFINDAQVTVADLEADNGVVHVINAVLLPPTTVWDVIVDSEDHNTLEAAITAAGLNTALEGEGPFTVFAPTDAAFAVLPQEVIDALLADPQGELTDILLYHVLGAEVRSTDLMDGMTAVTLNGKVINVTINDDGVFINDAQVTVADIEADNGVVHVINAVLLPPTTVWDIIVDSEDHTILEQVIEAAELDGALNGPGPLTVFAPNDAAFAAIPQEVINELLADPQGNLSTILLYHVVGARVLSTDLMDGMTATTLQGGDIDITINDDGIFVDNAQVIAADLEADNGVVHVIDSVLLAAVNTRSITYELVDVQVYPNPTAESFTLDWKGNFDAEADIRLINASGQLVKNWVSTFSHQSFNVQELPSGTYFLEVTSERKKAIKLLMIE